MNRIGCNCDRYIKQKEYFDEKVHSKDHSMLSIASELHIPDKDHRFLQFDRNVSGIEPCTRLGDREQAFLG